MIEARHARSDEVGHLAGALARAFLDDPAMTWLFGERDAPRLRRLRAYFASEARRHARHGGTVLTADGRPGAAFWDAPERWRTTWPAVLRSAPMMLRAIGPRIPRALRGLGLLEAAHPRAPHWYLSVLGTDPPAQGRGVGAALISPMLDRCDEAGLGAYLESSKAENVPYYERFGFAVTGEITLPGGPPVWPMWRDPR
ncbi:MAG TPA: GNAT family N-acetyltransferase [Acidimicrobiales bacterium]|nr:GNAT family N-acetyltransferase [Acidimicrobiales bacterium]